MPPKQESYLKKLFTEPKIPIGIFVLAILILLAITSFSGFFGELVSETTRHDHYYLNQKVSIHQIGVAVEGVREDTAGSKYYPLLPGNKFILVKVAIENQQNTNFELIPLLFFYLKDSNGRVYNVSAAPIGTDNLTGPILPHETVREEIGFEVPNNIPNPELYFERGTSDHPVVAFRLYQP